MGPSTREVRFSEEKCCLFSLVGFKGDLRLLDLFLFFAGGVSNGRLRFSTHSDLFLQEERLCGKQQVGSFSGQSTQDMSQSRVSSKNLPITSESGARYLEEPPTKKHTHTQEMKIDRVLKGGVPFFGTVRIPDSEVHRRIRVSGLGSSGRGNGQFGF